MHKFELNGFGKTASIILLGSIVVSGCNNPFSSGKTNRLKGELEVLQIVLDNRDAEIVQLKGENARLRVKAGESSTDMTGDNGTGSKPHDLNPINGGTKQSSPIISGSIEYSNNGTYGVHIASYRVRENAAIGWKKARDKNPDLYIGAFAKLMQLNLPSLGGAYYRLKIGPFATATGALNLCVALEKRGEFCKVTPFDGNRIK